MINKIILKNINSIGTCEIDFSKKNYKFLEDNILNGRVNPIAIYGHNGSGKSSFFKGIQQLIFLMISPVDNLVPFVVNQFDLKEYIDKLKKAEQGQIEYKDVQPINGSILIDFSIGDDQYKYFISTSPINRIENEYLKVNDEYIFEREINSEKYKNGLTKIELKSRSLLVPTLRYLASIEINDEKIQNAYKFITSFTFVDLPRQAAGAYVSSKIFNNMSVGDLMVSKSEEVKDILKDYDEFPIYSIIKKETQPGLNSQNDCFIKYDGLENAELPLTMISDGMRNQSLLLSILLSLPENGVLFIDELELALHPTAIVSFLNVVKKKSIQLVFSSHNTHILQHLRPDQIYFAKWNRGYSTYYRLSQIYPNIREINNIEKMYFGKLFDIED